MRKIISLLSAIVLGASVQTACMPSILLDMPYKASALEKKIRIPLTRKFYDTFVYKDFDKINFDDLPKQRIELPWDFEKNILLEESLWGFQDYSRFEKQALKELKDYIPNGLENASVEECLYASMQVVMDKIKYKEVDKTRIDLFNKRKLDLYWYKGIGDCDKYADLLIQVFNIVKRNNKNCNNVYVTCQVGGKNIPHAWNSVWLIYENNVIMSQIDITSWDNGGKLEATKFHLNKNPNLLKMHLADRMNDHKTAVEFLEKEYENIKENPNIESKFFEKMIVKKSELNSFLYTYIIKQSGQRENNNAVNCLKKIINAHKDTYLMYKDDFVNYDSILKNAIAANFLIGNKKKADKLIGEYKSLFPNKELFSKYSIWRNPGGNLLFAGR